MFGISTSTIAAVMVILLGIVLATTAFIAVSNRTMFRLGLRNILRRRVQSGLIVFGLMLSTLIVTAAFATGDTIDHSLSKGSYDVLSRSDLDITWNGERDLARDAGATNPGQQVLIDGSVVDGLEQQFASDPDIDGFLPALYVLGAAQNLRTGDASPSLQFAGYAPGHLARAGGLRTLDGTPVDVSTIDGQSVLLSERAAEDLHASEGDLVRLYGASQVREFRVAAIVQDEIASGVLGLEYTFVPGGVALPLSTLRDLAGVQPNAISALTVALRGSVRSTVGQAHGPKARLDQYLAGGGAELFARAGLPSGQAPSVDPIKQRLVDDSEATGNVIVTLFLILGSSRSLRASSSSS
jgi:putative ABC transport system permease protein